MFLNVGEISFINFIPLKLCAERFPFARKTFSLAPSKLNNMCRDGALDISAVSFFAYKDIEKSYARLPNFCIATDGEVKSIELFSNFEFGDLKGKKVFATSFSENSIAALSAVSKFKFGFDVFENRSNSVEEADAALMIGDLAMTYSSKFAFKFDVGELWRETFNAPLICSCIAVKREIYDEIKGEIFAYYENSLLEFEKNIGRYCELAAVTLGKPNFSADDARLYYSGLKYRMDEFAFKKTRDIFDGKFA